MYAMNIHKFSDLITKQELFEQRLAHCFVVAIEHKNETAQAEFRRLMKNGGSFEELERLETTLLITKKLN